AGYTTHLPHVSLPHAPHRILLLFPFIIPRPPTSTLFPYTTLFRSGWFAFFMGLAFQGISLYLVSLGQSSTKDVVGLAVGTLIFWLVGGLTLHSRIPKHASITHTQYGIVNGKWPSPARSGNTNGR